MPFPAPTVDPRSRDVRSGIRPENVRFTPLPPDLPPHPSILHLVLASAARYPDSPALVYRRGEAEDVLTYGALVEAIEDTALGLRALGFAAGERAAILSHNRPEWAVSDLAVMALGGVTVPIHHTLPPAQLRYILNDAGIRVLFVDDAAQLAKVGEIAAECPALRQIVRFDAAAAGGTGHVDYAALVASGRARRDEEHDFLRRAVAGLAPETACSIVYTSGTTGDPKGVVLRHAGFVTVVMASETVLGLRHDDVFFSFLPMSHLYERLAGHWCALYRGATVVYAGDTSRVLEDLARVRPTVMVSVPRVYEKLRSRVNEQAAAAGPLRRRVYEAALRTGLAHHEARLRGHVSPGLAVRHALAERFVFRPILARLGGRFRHAISGGAPLSVDTLRFFQALGLHMIEGYGMTETHLIVTLTPPGRARWGSCGVPIPGVEVAIADDGEILVRGPTVMLGYHGKPEQTREVLDEAGWLHSGDLGAFDDDGFLSITGRKKDLIVTANGKKVAPAPIENDLRASDFIEEICLTGDGRKFIAAVIVPDFPRLERWAAEHGLGGTDRAALVARPEVVERIRDEVQARQAAYAGHEQVKKFVLLPEPFSLERGELTPSLKVRRRVVEEHFRDAIERLYS